MSASTLRRLAQGVLVFALAVPNPAAAMPWSLDDLFGRVRGFISSIWAPSGCEVVPDGRCGAAPTPGGTEGPVLGESRCVLMPDGRCGAAPTLVFNEARCLIEPDGRCKE